MLDEKHRSCNGRPKHSSHGDTPLKEKDEKDILEQYWTNIDRHNISPVSSTDMLTKSWMFCPALVESLPILIVYLADTGL